MQSLDLNLASRPFRNNTLVWTAHALAAALLLSFSYWNARTYLDESRTWKTLKTGLRGVEQHLVELDLREQRAEAGIRRIDVEDLDNQTQTANGFIARKALSWTRLFNLLEVIVPYEVRMTAVRPMFAADPGAERRSPEGSVPVAIQGTARNLEAFLELERALITDAHFAQVEPEKSDIEEGGEVLFDLRFLYYPEGLPAGREAVELPHVLEAAAETPATRSELEALDRANVPPGTSGGEPAIAPPAPKLPPKPAVGGGAPPPQKPKRPR